MLVSYTRRGSKHERDWDCWYLPTSTWATKRERLRNGDIPAEIWAIKMEEAILRRRLYNGGPDRITSGRFVSTDTN